jgi:hypothetical protein
MGIITVEKAMSSSTKNKTQRIKMDLTEKDWVTYKRFGWGKGKHAQLKQVLLLILVFFILPVFAFYNIADTAQDPSRNTWVGSYYILILFVYLLYKWFIGYPLKYRQTPELFQVKLTYEFFEDSFKVIKKGPVYAGEMTLAYTELRKVYETRTCFYFTLNKGYDLILRKELCEDPNGLSLKLSHKLMKKFVDCR